MQANFASGQHPGKGFGERNVARMGNLQVRWGAEDDPHRASNALDQGSLVRALHTILPGPAVCFQQKPSREALRRLGLPDGGAIQRCLDLPLGRHPLQGVSRRYSSDCTIGTSGKRYPGYDFCGNEWPGAIVHQDRIRVFRQCLESAPNRVAPLRASRHDPDPEPDKPLRGCSRMSRREHHNDRSDVRVLQKGADGSEQDRLACDLDELFRNGTAEPPSGSPGDDYGACAQPNTRSMSERTLSAPTTESPFGVVCGRARGAR